MINWGENSKLNLKKRNLNKKDLMDKSLEYSVVIKLVFHYTTSIMIVFTYNMPHFISFGSQTISANPEKSF